MSDVDAAGASSPRPMLTTLWHSHATRLFCALLYLDFMRAPTGRAICFFPHTLEFPVRTPHYSRRGLISRVALFTVASIAAGTLTFGPMLAALADKAPPGTRYCTHGPPLAEEPTAVTSCEVDKCCKKITNEYYDDDGNLVHVDYEVECVECPNDTNG